MLPNLVEYHKPESPDEALRLLQRRKLRTVALAGGASLLARYDPSVQVVVDLSGLHMDYIHEDVTGISVGAMTTLQHLLESPVLGAYAGGLLATAAHHAATRTIRNAATIGGSICSSGSANDVVTALLALDAEIVSEHPRRKLSDILDGRALRSTARLLDWIILPPDACDWCGALCRVARLPSDQAIVNVAVTLHCQDGVCTAIRLAAGGVGKTPSRLTVAERMLLGTRLTASDLERAADAQCKEVSPPSNLLGSAEYRRAMLGVLIQRAVRQCGAREGER